MGLAGVFRVTNYLSAKQSGIAGATDEGGDAQRACRTGAPASSFQSPPRSWKITPIQDMGSLEFPPQVKPNVQTVVGFSRTHVNGGTRQRGSERSEICCSTLNIHSFVVFSIGRLHVSRTGGSPTVQIPMMRTPTNQRDGPTREKYVCTRVCTQTESGRKHRNLYYSYS